MPAGVEGLRFSFINHETSSLLVAQIGLTDTHTDISHWTQSCRSYTSLFHGVCICKTPMYLASIRMVKWSTTQRNIALYCSNSVLDMPIKSQGINFQNYYVSMENVYETHAVT